MRRDRPFAAACTRSFSPRARRRTSCSPTAATFPTPPPTSRRPTPSSPCATARRAGDGDLRASAGASPASTAGASSPTPRTSTWTAASRRAGSTRSRIPRSARRCSVSPWRRSAIACPGSSTASAAAGHPAPGRLRWAYAYGRSQTGRLLRTLVYEDLNLDEDGREALDGIIANVAGGMRGEFNQRFGQNSKDRNNMMAHLFPFTDQPRERSGHGREGRAPRAARRARKPAARLLHQHLGRVPPGRRLAHPHRSRRPSGRSHTARAYASTTSRAPSTGSASGRPPTPRSPPPTRPARSSAPSICASVVDYAPLLRACLVHLDRWVVEGVEPPPSRHPRLADGTAVPPEALAHAVRSASRGALSDAPSEAAAARLDEPAAPARARVRLARLRGGRGRQRDRRHPAARAQRAAGHAYRMEPPASRTSAAPSSSWCSRARPCPSAARAPSARRRATRARPSRSATPRAPSISIACARRPGRLPEAGYLLDEDVEVSVAAGGRLWDQFAAAGG